MRSQHTQRRPGNADRRCAHTLLELVAAASLLAATLAPALRILRDALEHSRRVESLHLLTTSCVSKLEEHLCLAGATWLETAVAGDLAAEGYPDVRFRVVRSQNALDGGIPDRLMSVVVTVWSDTDSDGALDAGEPSAVMGGKVAKMARYRDEAGT